MRLRDAFHQIGNKISRKESAVRRKRKSLKLYKKSKLNLQKLANKQETKKRLMLINIKAGSKTSL